MKKERILEYIGNIAQIGGSRPYVLVDGWGRNLRCIDIDSGNGLKYTILPDRGMDISLASFKGTNLVYLTPNSETHPAFFEPEKLGWLRTFNGGLLTTCGLTYLGAPTNDKGEELGLHGRYSTIPAKKVADLSQWSGDEYIIKIKGISEEASLFGNKLRLERELTTVAGTNDIEITDTITNFGFTPSPYMILYHMNFGYPMLSEDSELVLNAEHTAPRDEIAAAAINDFKRFSVPQVDFSEQVFIHKMKNEINKNCMVTLRNKRLGIAISITFNTDTLPYLIEWKMLGKGEYVLGLEPSNVPLNDRKSLRESKKLPHIKSGESIVNKINIIIN